MRIVRHFVLAAGGTGGHMIPAHALAGELMSRGHHVALITDERGARIPGLFDGAQTHVLPAGRLAGGPMGWFKAGRSILAGRAMAARLYETFEPSAVIGFGGYPALPALLAATSAKIPTAVHEQNAVLGRVNRFLAGRVDAIVTAYPDIQRLKDGWRHKTHLLGNPVRDEVLALRDQPFPALSEDGIFRLLVTGGSQGATILSDVVPEALGLLPLNFRRRLQVTQQCRVEDIDRVRATYADLGIPADLATYLPDLPERLGWAHLVIARAGASTIAELTAAGRPAILVPLPSATDNHQTYNVREMVDAGGARAIQQSAFTPVELAKQMQKLALEPGALANAAKRAWNCGRPNAARDLADLVENLGPQPVGGEPIRMRPAQAPVMGRQGAVA
ncbi:undecaprenyldiphospho-muramoylpentapeptide beta-N-acetylglucosaminyltransferase [Sphingomonas cavernae]|uniref:UDP-N-acetylglucosamine--N-acetylmuramyl-(pentapeptide) pyrophosphoryl-undecaprenol N-acetylglucosamine transferase n=1 Tax=Sphingomonas cavernae TaxID=2320861 RepID=A0A418WNA7_9SPHN|nr:undecaprenyldiphospho-muramoylpentapeptide beta-N-acetylglucosaminyltransferase [Sphingomonas cavernae]RJF91498.1 undecaprenyldiphospho-muramoylpentapeptide beta-N-acetylglucosaminyltransferase [Sphingomonas cavernae]